MIEADVDTIHVTIDNIQGSSTATEFLWLGLLLEISYKHLFDNSASSLCMNSCASFVMGSICGARIGFDKDDIMWSSLI